MRCRVKASLQGLSAVMWKPIYDEEKCLRCGACTATNSGNRGEHELVLVNGERVALNEEKSLLMLCVKQGLIAHLVLPSGAFSLRRLPALPGGG